MARSSDSESAVLEKGPLNVAKRKLKLCWKAARPFFLHGPPGVGKSAMVKEAAEEAEVSFIDLRMSLLNPVDLRGIPVADLVKAVARWLVPEFMPKTGKGILFLDELNVAPPSVQAASYQLVLDGRVGEYVLPKGWWICAAGNRSIDRALTYDMPSALRNRFVHYEVESSVEPWALWAAKMGLDFRVVSFIRFREKEGNPMLFDFDPRIHVRAFPTPRSWHMVSDLLLAGAEPTLTKGSSDLDLLAGAVGSGAAQEFSGYCAVMASLPNADDIVVKGKMSIPMPDELGAKYAFCGALVSATVRVDDADGLKAAKNLTKYCVQSVQEEEYGALILKDFAKTKRFAKIFRQVVATSEWQEAFDKYGDLTLE